jgi:hypothetical protein
MGYHQFFQQSHQQAAEVEEVLDLLFQQEDLVDQEEVEQVLVVLLIQDNQVEQVTHHQ